MIQVEAQAPPRRRSLDGTLIGEGSALRVRPTRTATPPSSPIAIKPQGRFNPAGKPRSSRHAGRRHSVVLEFHLA
jgi:hypothetical protein